MEDTKTVQPPLNLTDLLSAFRSPSELRIHELLERELSPMIHEA